MRASGSGFIVSKTMQWMKNLTGLCKNQNNGENLNAVDGGHVTVNRRHVLEFIGVDDNGLFSRYVHATSSGRIDDIRRNGLVPLEDPRNAVIAYLRGLPLEITDEMIAAVLDHNGAQNHPLLHGRFNNFVSKTFMLPLLGADLYLRNAADNAIADGGEIYMVAREAMERHLGFRVAAAFPNATTRILVAKLYFETKNGQLTIPAIDDFFPLNIKDIAPEMVLNNMEVRVARRIPPRHIRNMSIDEFFDHHRIVVSRRAVEALVNMRV
jgi:hypothetical protein